MFKFQCKYKKLASSRSRQGVLCLITASTVHTVIFWTECTINLGEQYFITNFNLIFLFMFTQI